MTSKNRIVASVLASLMLSACSSSDHASNEYCQDPTHNHITPVSSHESLAYAGPINRVGYKNIYDRYSELDTLYFEPTFTLVEGSLLVHMQNHTDDVYPTGNEFENWLMVQSGNHHQVCSQEHPSCLTDKQLERFYQRTGAHSNDYDRSKFLSTIGSEDRIQFEFDSAKLDEKAIFEAQEIAEYLKRYPSKKILILGSADSIGDAKYNKALSRKRAESLKQELIKLGIPNDQIVLSWKGEYQSGEGAEFRIAELSYE
ncbi:OmpA family protein [Vibrio parahaemolyticus]|nr:OmpA family protein [Vibrio parahaemolyticus]